MITKTGTGAQSSQVFYTSNLPEGFYTLGYCLEASPLPGSPTPFVRLDVTTPSPFRSGNAVVTNSVPKAVGTIDNVYVDPTGTFSYVIGVYNNGSNPPPAWTAKFWLYAAADVAT